MWKSTLKPRKDLQEQLLLVMETIATHWQDKQVTKRLLRQEGLQVSDLQSFCGGRTRITALLAVGQHPPGNRTSAATIAAAGCCHCTLARADEDAGRKTRAIICKKERARHLAATSQVLLEPSTGKGKGRRGTVLTTQAVGVARVGVEVLERCCGGNNGRVGCHSQVVADSSSVGVDVAGIGGGMEEEAVAACGLWRLVRAGICQ